MGIRSRRADARAEVRRYHVEPKGSRVPSGKVYAGNGTFGPNVPEVRVTARPRIKADGRETRDFIGDVGITGRMVRDIYGPTRKGSRSAARSEATPVRAPKVGTIRYGSGLESVGLLSD